MRWILIALAALALWSPVAAAQVGVSLSGTGRGSLVSGGGGGAGACVAGSTCLCDTLTPGTFSWCEDFEDAGLYTGTSTNRWSATNTGTGNRGDNSLWNRRYSNTSGGGFRASDPAPTIDPDCTAGSECSGSREYCSAAQGATMGLGNDCWGPGANSGSFIDIQSSGDYNAELGTLSLTGGKGVTSDVGAGNAHFAYRIGPGQTSGKAGTIGHQAGSTAQSFDAFGQATDVAVTFAMAYPTNSFTAGASPWAAQWKHDEWCGTGCGSDISEHWYQGKTGSQEGVQDAYPFSPFMFTTSQAACNAAIAAPGFQVLVGHAGVSCSSTAFRYGAAVGTGVGLYRQSTDWPLGTWHCVQARIQGMGTTNTTIQVWFDEELIIHITGFNGASAMVNQYYDSMFFNAYANTNQFGGTPTTQTAYRYMDNLVIRTNQAPVSCATIGY